MCSLTSVGSDALFASSRRVGTSASRTLRSPIAPSAAMASATSVLACRSSRKWMRSISSRTQRKSAFCELPQFSSRGELEVVLALERGRAALIAAP